MQPSQIGKIVSANVSNEVSSPSKFPSTAEISGKPFNSFLTEASPPQNPMMQAEVQRCQAAYDQAKEGLKAATKALIAEMQHLDQPGAKAELEKVQKDWNTARTNQRDAFNNLQNVLNNSQNTAVAQNDNIQSFPSASEDGPIAQTIQNHVPSNISSPFDSCNSDNFSAHFVTGCFSGSTESLLPLLKPQTSFLGASSELTPIQGESAMGLTPLTADESTTGLSGSPSMVFNAVSSNLNMLNPVDNDSINHTAALVKKLKDSGEKLEKTLDQSTGAIFFGEEQPDSVTILPAGINAINPAVIQQMIVQPNAANAAALHAAAPSGVANVSAPFNTVNAANVAAPAFSAVPQANNTFLPPSAGFTASPIPVNSNSITSAPTSTGAGSATFIATGSNSGAFVPKQIGAGSYPRTQTAPPGH